MSEYAVEVNDLGKRYRLGAGQTHDTLREAITYAAKAPFRNLKRLRGLTSFDGATEEDVVCSSSL